MDDEKTMNRPERHIILDALRGIAVLGIVMANFPEFSLYTFLDEATRAGFSTSSPDGVVRWLQYIFIDGKFYSIFSLLFGIGFTIIIQNSERRGINPYPIFYRRMTVLLIVGLLHMMLLWSGDILMLYAVLGMCLPLFFRFSDRVVLILAAFFLALPVTVDAAVEFAGLSLSAPFVDLQWKYCDMYGITEDNFAIWLRDAESYREVLRFLVQGACVRMQEFIDGNRYFRVMGLFLIGMYIGRNRMYAELESRRSCLKKISIYGFSAGLPLSLVYAWSSMNGKPLGLTVHSVLYLVSVFPLAFAYVATVCLWSLKSPDSPVLTFFAAPGRMAMTNYIFQSVAGLVIFYGVGFGLGSGMGLVYVEIVAISVFVLQAVFSASWLRRFRYGPLEWIWRMITYKKFFTILK